MVLRRSDYGVRKSRSEPAQSAHSIEILPDDRISLWFPPALAVLHYQQQVLPHGGPGCAAFWKAREEFPLSQIFYPELFLS